MYLPAVASYNGIYSAVGDNSHPFAYSKPTLTEVKLPVCKVSLCKILIILLSALRKEVHCRHFDHRHFIRFRRLVGRCFTMTCRYIDTHPCRNVRLFHVLSFFAQDWLRFLCTWFSKERFIFSPTESFRRLFSIISIKTVTVSDIDIQPNFHITDFKRIFKEIPFFRK